MNSNMQKRTYTVEITKDLEDGGFVGRCEELHANSQGETFGQIMENMQEAVECATMDIDHANDFNLSVIRK